MKLDTGSDNSDVDIKVLEQLDSLLLHTSPALTAYGGNLLSVFGDISVSVTFKGV